MNQTIVTEERNANLFSTTVDTKRTSGHASEQQSQSQACEGVSRPRFTRLPANFHIKSCQRGAVKGGVVSTLDVSVLFELMATIVGGGELGVPAVLCLSTKRTI
eukprot:6467595-Amphidinium_carterae.1